MATSHIQPLVLLLVSLFFLPALRAIRFKYCNRSGYDFAYVYSVDISPNPVGPNDSELSITLTGFTKESIGKGVIEVYAESDKVTDLLKRFDLCGTGKPCPFKAGTDFVLPLSKIPKDILEGEYKYVVTLYDVDAAKEPPVKMCIDFYLPISTLTMVSA